MRDVLYGIALLKLQGVTVIGLAGPAFGGAVAIQAAAMRRAARTVAGLAPQSDGAEAECDLAPRASLFLIHGGAGAVLPDACSR